MSGTRKRRGTTLVELSLVIAILAMIALPFAAFVSQNLKNTMLASTQLKEQMVLEQVMQDMEKHLRSAISMNGTTPCPITFPTGGISFTSRDPQPDAASLTVIATHDYTYVLAGGLLTKTVGTNSGTFPDGLEPNMITSLTFPTGTGQQHLVAAMPPCYLTVRIEAYNAALQTTTALQKTIYLRNYTLIVDIAKILGVTAPVAGATPVTTATTAAEYTAGVTWLPVHATFAPGTPYTATITLTPTAGYTLTGVAANLFTVAGATTVRNDASSGVVTAVFPATAAAVIDIAAILGVTPPVKGATPVSTITQTAQYTGTVTWIGQMAGGKFKTKTVYTAIITITPEPGYTLTGVAANFFTVAGATTVTNAADTGVVEAEFPKT